MSYTKVDNFPKAVVEFQQRSELLVCVDSKLSGNLSDLITGRFCQRPESFITPNLINVSHCDSLVCHLLQNLLVSRKDICQDSGIIESSSYLSHLTGISVPTSGILIRML